MKPTTIACPLDALYVDKASETGADQLLAAGLAKLVYRIMEKEDRRVVLRDRGSHYQITIAPAITAGHLAALGPIRLVAPLVTAKKLEKAEGSGRTLEDGFLYDAARAVRTQYNATRKLLTGKLRGPDARLRFPDELKALLGELEAPDSRLPTYDTMNAFKVADSVNALATTWARLPPEAYCALVAALLATFARIPNDLDGLEVRWKEIAKHYGLQDKALVTQLQMTNPAAGKGANRAKSNGISMGNLETPWPLELLRVAGYFMLAASVTVQTGRGENTKDRKTYILRPEQVEITRLDAMMSDFREVLWASTAVKLDIMAVLRFAQVFLARRRLQLSSEHSECVDEEDIATLTRLVQGFDVVLSKDMGSALATMNMATINVPQWLPRADDVPAADGVLRLLDEHLDVVRAIGDRGPGKGTEEASEEYDLLRHYRDFLSSRGDFSAFFAFTSAYGPYILAQRGHNRRAVQLSTTNLEVIMQTSSYREITANLGFQDIADCIRQATVTEQYRASVLRQGRYEIRYGLGQDLARAARDNKEFLIALSGFLRAYGAENAREEEKLANRYEGKIPEEVRKSLRPAPRTGDIDEVVRLVDTHGADLVCSLLLAYGYARKGDPRQRRDDVPDTAGTQPALDDSSTV